MADYSNIVKLVLEDSSYADRLIAEPEATLRADGIEPDSEVIEALGNMNAEAVRNLADAFGKSKAAT